MDQSGESGEEQSRRLPHPGGEEREKSGGTTGEELRVTEEELAVVGWGGGERRGKGEGRRGDERRGKDRLRNLLENRWSASNVESATM